MSREGRKELLFKAAFKLFVTKQFDGVSISDIEKETGLTRGAVFYYAETKRDLYEMVMRHYLVERQNVRRKVQHPVQCTLLEYIDYYIDGVKNTMDIIVSIIDASERDRASRAYLTTLMQVSGMFPDFKKENNKNIQRDITRWKNVIKLAIEKGEVKDDIDVSAVARQFVCLFYGSSFADSFSRGLDIKLLRKQMLLLYNFIKKG